MALFGVNNFSESVANNTMYSNCSNFMEAAISCLQETAYDYESIERGLRNAEISYIKEHGVPMVYTEASIGVIVKNALEAIKDWFKRIMGVIGKFFAELKARIVAVKKNVVKSQDSKDTIVKFEKSMWNDNKNFDGYDFESTSYNKLMDFNLMVPDNKIYLVVENGEIVERSTDDDEPTSIVKPSVADFKNACLKKKNITGADIDGGRVLQVITNYDRAFNTIKETQRDAKNALDKYTKGIKEIAKLQKEFKQYDEQEKETYNRAVKLVGQICAYNTTVVTAKFTLLVAKFNQNVKIAQIILSLSKKSGKKGSGNDKASKIEEESKAAATK